MPKRFIFRQVQIQDIELFLRDGEVRARNHPVPQKCHQVSAKEIVSRRHNLHFQDKTSMDDYVPFYFSPITAYNFSMCKGNVSITPPPSHPIQCSEGQSDPHERVFIICEADNFRDSDIKFSNQALNKEDYPIKLEGSSNLKDLEKIINWRLFDEEPKIAKVLEIGYDGACGSFRDIPDSPYATRKSETMAEFLVKHAVPLNKVKALVVHPDCPKKQWLEQQIKHYGYNIHVYANKEFFFA